jgi:hypothetical protein
MERMKLTPGSRNIIIDGTFGQVERRVYSSTPENRYFSTTTTATISDGDSTITVVDGSGFRPRDVIILRSGDPITTYKCHAIINSIDGNTINIDPLNFYSGSSSDSGSTVITYGQVPEEVEEAALRLVIRNQFPLNSDEAQNQALKTRIIGERTDNYEYRLANPFTSSSKNGVLLPESGDEEVDRLLRSVMASKPVYFGAP